MQQDVPAGCRQNLRDQRHCLGLAAFLDLPQQSRQDGRVVVDDCIGDQACALVADFDFDLSARGEFLVSGDRTDVYLPLCALSHRVLSP